MSIITVVSSLTKMFLLILVGFLIVKLSVVPVMTSKAMSALILNVCLPASIFVSLVKPYDSRFLVSGAISIISCTLLLILYIVLSIPLSRLFRVSDGRKGMWQFCASFSNNAFMGYPVVLALCGSEGLALAVFFSIPVATIYNTLGVYQILKDTDSFSMKKTSLSSLLINPINCMIVLGLICCMVQIDVPDVVMSPIQYLSNITTPMSMMITGMALAQGSAKGLYRDKDCFTMSLTRLLIFPLITLLILKQIPFTNELLLPMMVLMMAMPSAAVGAMLAEQFGGNRDFGAQCVFVSSLLCLVTIPIIAMLL